MNSKQVKHLRKVLGVSQEQFALYFGFSVATVNRWELGRHAPTELPCVILTLLQDVLQLQDPQEVLRQVRVRGPSQKEILRYLFQLDDNPLPDGPLPNPFAETSYPWPK